MKIEELRKDLLDKAMQAENGTVEITKEEAVELHIILTEVGKLISEVKRWEKEPNINAI